MARKATAPVVATSTSNGGTPGQKVSDGGKDVVYLGYGK